MFNTKENNTVFDDHAWDITDAIKSLRPNAAFQYYEGSFLQYFDQDMQRPPSNQEIQQESERLKSIAYKAKRASEYPPIEDFVDAYYWKENGDDSLMIKWLETVKNIKSEYPKL